MQRGPHSNFTVPRSGGSRGPYSVASISRAWEAMVYYCLPLRTNGYVKVQTSLVLLSFTGMCETALYCLISNV